MKLYEGLNSRIATAFCLTISNRVVTEISKTFSEMDVFKILLVASIIVNFISTRAKVVATNSPVATLRQVSVIALANSLMKIATVQSLSSNSHTLWLPWAPVIQSFTRTILLVVGISWASSTLLATDSFKQFAPEIQRISYALQYLFADEVAPLLVDPVLRRVTFVLGIASLQIITRNFQSSPYSVTSILYNSASMVWANVAMAILSPSTSQLLALTLTVNVSIACGLSVLGSMLTIIEQLLPYIEWYAARDLVRVCKENGIDTFSMLSASILVSSALAAYMRSQREGQVDKVLQTCINISAVLTSNLAADEIIKRFDSGIVNVATGAIFATMIFQLVLGAMRGIVGET